MTHFKVKPKAGEAITYIAIHFESVEQGYYILLNTETQELKRIAAKELEVKYYFAGWV